MISTYFQPLIEWVCAFLSIGGAIVLSIKGPNTKSGWSMWLIATTAMSVLFIYTQQWGLVFFNIGGTIVNFVGLRRASNNDATKPKGWMRHINAQNLLYLLMVVFAINLIRLMFNQTQSNLEWVGSTLSLCASALFSTNSPHSKHSWIIWITSNIVIFLGTILSGQHGITFMQLGFFVVNLVGFYNWVFLPWKKQHHFLKHELQ